MKNTKALYVHIPFCKSICAYCDFCRILFDERLISDYLIELEKELTENQISNLETIYIGGGTPSALTIAQLEFLFQILSKYRQSVIEYTIEVNPETLSQEKVDLFAYYGINRVSMGVQAIQDTILQSLHRHHVYDDVVSCIDLLKKKGINNISIDLMYSLPNQTMQDWQETLAEAVHLGISHISLYSLTIEENSYFGRNNIVALDEDVEAEMYLYAIDYLKKNGFDQYEISNFAKDGKESFHNKVYWNYEDFYAVGLGASGKLGSTRFTNTTKMAEYLAGKRRDEEILLSKEEEMFEFIMMNLRKKEGFSKTEFYERFSVQFKDYYRKPFQLLVSENRIEEIADRIQVIDRYLPVLNSLLIYFMD